MSDAAPCTACPICVLLYAKPEATRHLLAAARELALAAQALLEPEPERKPHHPLEHIPIE